MLTYEVNNTDRKDTEIIWSGGSFRYRILPDFPKIPREISNIRIAGGCCDKDGFLYITSRDMKHPIIVLDPDGNYVKSIGQDVVHSTHFIIATPGDTLIVMDSWTQVARELTKDGEQIRVFGTENEPNESGLDPRIYYEMRRAGKIFPSEYGEEDHWAFIMARECIRDDGVLPRPFNKPTDVTINSKGEYFFSDGYGGVYIHKFDADGNFVKTWGEKGFRENMGPGKIYCPHSIVADSRDRIWLGDREADALHVYDSDGNLLAHISEGFYQPSGVWADEAYVYAVGRGGILAIFDMDFEVVAQIGFFNSDLRAHDMCGNRNGDLFLFPTNANIDHQVIKLQRLS